MDYNDTPFKSYEFEFDGYPAFAIINSTLDGFDNKAAYPVSVFIGIEPEQVDENGHPSDAEYEYLEAIESRLLEKLKPYDVIYVGHTTIPQRREIIFYIPNDESLIAFFEEWGTTTGRLTDVDIEEDADWENIQAFID
ncbi:hypothetical protein GCM10023149_38630 [Mucilaginibacter gynuensis]|uniref:DUF695 domain-containing protein n=1 Tax=Mucilaginibacter gynuensis TaxID=1302236 RepID=A0ABP8GZT0_9SPHI